PLDADSAKLLCARKAHETKIKGVTDELRKARAELKTAEDRATMRVPARLAGIVVDNVDAKLIGSWKTSTFSRPYVGSNYIHDDRSGQGKKFAIFTPTLPRPGTYEVLISYTTGSSRATNVPVTVKHAD